MIYRNIKIRKDILLWVEDAIELNAYCRNLDIKYWLGIPLNKVQVEFEIDGIQHVCGTENERQGVIDWGRPIGYFTGISKFADKQIKILYSPKYNQVMILKNK